MTEHVLDTAKSRVTVNTFAEGLFARLAHDLELVCGDLSGSATRDGSTGRATIAAPLRAVAVTGAVKDGRVDARALSASDRDDILGKVRRDVFRANEDAAIKVDAELDGQAATLRVTTPSGRTAEVRARPVLAEDSGSFRITGSFEISLAALGAATVKGPMGAFRVRDRIVIGFDLVFCDVA